MMSVQKAHEVYEDEIDLVEIVAVLWRRKWLILSVAVIVSLACALHSFSKEKLYTVSATVMPNSLSYDESGDPQYVDDVKNFKAKINGGCYWDELKSKSSDGWLPSFSVNVNEVAREIVISSNVVKERVDQTKILLGDLSRLVNRDYENRVLIQLQAIELEQEKLAMLLKEEQNIVAEMKAVSLSMSELVERRDNFIKQNPSASDSTALLYATAIQQDRGYLNQLSNQLKSVRAQLLLNKFKFQKMKLANDSGDGQQIVALVTIHEPAATTSPISQHGKRNVLLSLIVGLILGVFVAFVVQFAEIVRHRKRNFSNHN